MPKLIANLRARLLAETRHQLNEAGYSNLKVRNVAKACGVSVGTVYNYFASKETLLVACLQEDWNTSLKAIRETAKSSPNPQPVLIAMYDQLKLYSAEHRYVFMENGPLSISRETALRQRTFLRTQLAEILQPYCSSPFCAEFIIESLFTWSQEGKTFQDLWPVLSRLVSHAQVQVQSR